MTRLFSLTFAVSVFYAVFFFGVSISALLGTVLGCISAITSLYIIDALPRRIFSTAAFFEIVNPKYISHFVIIPFLAWLFIPLYVSETNYPCGVLVFGLCWMGIALLSFVLIVADSDTLFHARHKIWTYGILSSLLVQFFFEGSLDAYAAPFVGLIFSSYASIKHRWDTNKRNIHKKRSA